MRATGLAASAVAIFGLAGPLVFSAGNASAAPTSYAPTVAIGGSGHVDLAGAAPTPGDEAAYVSHFRGVSSSTLNLSMKVPAITCTSAVTSEVIDSASIFGANSDAGFEAAGVSLVSACSGSAPSYSVVGIVDDSADSSSVPVSVGDTINVALVVSTTFETASFADSTNGGGTYVDGIGFNATGAASDVQGGYESGGFPKFSPVKFESIKLNGAALGNSGPTAYDQVNAKGKTEIKVSALTNGKAFTATWVTSK